MKTKRFQWLSDLRKLIRNNLCWWLRRKNRRRNEYDSYCEIATLSEFSFSSFRDSIPLNCQTPIRDLSSSAYQDSSSDDYPCSNNVDDTEDASDLIILINKNMTQLPFPKVRRNTSTLPVIPLPFINSVASIREGSIIEFQIKLPETINYEDMIFNTLTSTIFTTSWGSYPFLMDKMRVVPYSGLSFFFLAEEIVNQQDKALFKECSISLHAGSDLGSGENIYSPLQQLMNATYNILLNEQKQFFYNSIGRDLDVLDMKIKTETAESGTEAVDISFPKTTLEEGSAKKFKLALPITIRYDQVISSTLESKISASSHGDYPFIVKEIPFPGSSTIFPARQMINQQGKPLAGNLYTTQRGNNKLGYNEESNISPQQVVDARENPSSKIYSEVMEIGRRQFTNSGSRRSQNTTILAEMAREGTKEDEVLIPKRSLQRHKTDYASSWLLPTMEGFEVLWSLKDCRMENMSFTAALEDVRHKTLYRGSYGDVNLVAAVYKDVMKQVNTDCLATIKSPFLSELFGIFHRRDQRWIIYQEAKYGDLDTFLQADILRDVIGEKVARFVVAKILLALHYLHGHGVAHGDIRPSKVLINFLGQPVLGGIETAFWPCNRTLMRRSATATKVGFVAPEIVKKSKPNPASDVFAVGCLGYFVVTGRYPFATKRELLCYTNIPAFPIKDFSYAGEQFLGACLQKQRVRRFKLDIVLRNIRSDEWFANWDIGAVCQNSPIIAAIECINKRMTLTSDEKRVSVTSWENNMNFICPTQQPCDTVLCTKMQDSQYYNALKNSSFLKTK